MKRRKKILCLALAGSLLLLAACGSGTDSGDKKENSGGRYTERDITPPAEGRLVSFFGADGTLVCYDDGLRTKYESKDGGGSWQQSPGPGGGTDRYMDLQAGTMLPDGSLLGFIPEEGLTVIAPDGSGSPCAVKGIDDAVAKGEHINLSLLQAAGNGRLLLSYSAGGMVMQSTQGARRIGGNASQESGPGNQTPPEGAPAEGAPAGGAIAGGATDAGTPAGGSGATGGQGPRQGGSRQGGTVSAGSITMQTLLLDFQTGEIIAELPEEVFMAAASDDNTLYLLDAAGKAASYSLADGKPSGQPAVEFGGGGEMTGIGMRLGGSRGSIMAVNAEGDIFTIQNGSLIKADAGGKTGTVLESTAYSVGTPRSSAEALFVLEDGSFVVHMLESGMNSRLYQYVWDENASVNPEKSLTVWSLEDNSFVRAAIAELRKQHSDAAITYEVALDGGGAVSAADAIKTLNTRLLGGKGPDILLLDGCSVESYADKGMLLDIKELVDTGDVFESLLAPYTKNGTLHCLPTQFLMPMLMASESNLAQAQTLSELVALAVQGNDLPVNDGSSPAPFDSVDEKDRAALYFGDLQELCDILWLSSAPAVVQENRLNTDALRRYLEAVKTISDKYALTETAQSRGGMRIAFSDGGSASVVPGSLMRYIMQHTNYAAFSAGNLFLLQMVMDRADSGFALFPGLTSGAWQPSAVAGVSADTEKRAFAAEFVQTMLSPAVQQLNYGTGLPVTRTGLAEQVEAANERRAENDQEPFTAFDPDALIGKLQSPSMGDTVLTEMMRATVEKCCKGQIDVEGAVREIEQNVKNYLAERA